MKGELLEDKLLKDELLKDHPEVLSAKIVNQPFSNLKGVRLVAPHSAVLK